MRQYAPKEQPLQWKTLTPQHMPPIGEEFLLWRACNESDGGFCTIGKRYEQRNDAPPIIAYLIGADDGFRRVLDFNEYKSCRWAAIPPPKCVIKKRIKKRQRMMERAKA